jgi:hypothetical protein
MDGACEKGLIIWAWEHLIDEGIVFATAATSQSTLKVACRARAGIENRPKTIAMC